MVYDKLKRKEYIEIQSHSLIIPDQLDLTNGDTSGLEYKYVEGKKTPTGRLSLGDRQLKYVSEVKKLIEDHFTSDYQKSHVDGLMWEVFRRYSSYIKRNKKLPKSLVKIRDKSMTLKSDIFKINLESKEVLIPKMEKKTDVMKVPYELSDHYLDSLSLLEVGKSKKTNMLTKAKGGIISFKKNELVLVADRVRSYDKAEDYVGIDINRSPENWLYFSKEIDGEHGFSKPDEIIAVEAQIRALHKKINKDKSIKSRQRSGLRKKWKKAHNRQQKLITDFLHPILEKLLLKYPSLGVGIDTVGTGQKNGTFGQDKVINAAQEFCRKNKLAHYFVPTPFTSQRCNECGKVSKLSLRKILKDQYVCIHCGHTEHADLNASKNVELFAKTLQDSGFEMIGTPNKKYKVESYRILNDKFKLKK
jgi:transposase